MRNIRSNKSILLILLLSFPTTILFGLISTNVHAADEDIPDENYKNDWHWHTDIQTDKLIIYEMEMTMRNLTSGKMKLISKELRIINITGFKNETSLFGFGNVSRIHGSLCYYNCTSDEIKAYKYFSDRSIAGFGYNDTGVFREYYDMGDDVPSLGCTFLPVNGTKGLATVDVDIMADIINKTYLDYVYQMGWAPKFNYYETDPAKNSIYFLNTTNNYFINNTYYDNGTLRNAEASYWLIFGTNTDPMEFNMTMKHVFDYDITNEIEWGVDVGDTFYYGWNLGHLNETKVVVTGFKNITNGVIGSIGNVYQCFEAVLVNLSYWDPITEEYIQYQENITVGLANNFYPMIMGGVPLFIPNNTGIEDLELMFNNYTHEILGPNSYYPFDEICHKIENGYIVTNMRNSTDDERKLNLIFDNATGICSLFDLGSVGGKTILYRKNMTVISNQAEAENVLLHSNIIGNNEIYMNFTYIPNEDLELYWAGLTVNPTLTKFQNEIYNMPLYLDVYANFSAYYYQDPVNMTLNYDGSLLSQDMENYLAPYYFYSNKWEELPEFYYTLDTDANKMIIMNLEYLDFRYPQFFALGIREWTWGVDVDDILPYELNVEGYDINTGDLLDAFLDFWIFNITSIEDETHDWHYEPHQTFSQVNFIWMYYNHSLGRLARNPNSPFGDPSPLMEFCDNSSSMVPLKFGDQNPSCGRIPFILPLTYGKLNLTILAPILNDTFFAVSQISKWDYYYADDVANTLFFFNSTYGYFMDLTYFEDGTLQEAKMYFLQPGSAVYNTTITWKPSWNVTSEIEWSVKVGDELYFGDMDKEFKYHIVEINETAVNMMDSGILQYGSIQSFSYVVGDIYHWNSTHEYWMFQYSALISAANNLYPTGFYYYIAYTLGLTPTWPSLLMPIEVDEYETLDAMKDLMGGMKVDTISEIGKYYIHFTNSTGPYHIYFEWDYSTGIVKLMYGFHYYPGEGWTDFVFFAKNRTDLKFGNNIIELDNYFVPDFTFILNITTNSPGCEFYYAILDINPTNETLPAGTGTPMFYGDMMINNHTKLAGKFTLEVKLPLTPDLDNINLHLSGWYPSIGGWQILTEEMMNQMVTYNYSGNSIIAEMTGDPYFCAIGAWSYTLNPPGAFTLTSTAKDPDDDGDFILTWGASFLATSYSVFQYSSVIDETNIHLATPLAIDISSLLFPIENYIDGTYYFIVRAQNAYSSTLSNCLEVVVELAGPPGSFSLTSDAGAPDDDGIFTLTWDAANGAVNYSVYRHTSFITEINGSLTTLATGITNLSRLLTGYSNGAYYFIVVAYNAQGDTLSNCHTVIVEIPPEEPSDGDGDGHGAIPGYPLYLLLIFFTVITAIIIKMKHKKLPKF